MTFCDLSSLDAKLWIAVQHQFHKWSCGSFLTTLNRTQDILHTHSSLCIRLIEATVTDVDHCVSLFDYHRSLKRWPLWTTTHWGLLFQTTHLGGGRYYYVPVCSQSRRDYFWPSETLPPSVSLPPWLMINRLNPSLDQEMCLNPFPYMFYTKACAFIIYCDADWNDSVISAFLCPNTFKLCVHFLSVSGFGQLVCL